MKWEKRNNAVHTIDDVISSNTGLSKDEFLHPKENVFIKGIPEALKIINKAIQNHEQITILGDYDCDGVTSSSILYRLFTDGYKYNKVKVRLPKRFSEGYGLSMKMIDEISSGLIITVDNGIAAVNEIQAAKDKGLTVVVVDHHLRREDNQLPNADVIIDPNAIEGSEFNGYCGAGLAYKIAQASGYADAELLSVLSSLAAMGTVADVVPLIKDNRNIVITGLQAINEGKVPLGLKELVEEMRVEYVKEGDIGYRLAPAINAASRMEDNGAMDAFRLLALDCHDPALAAYLVEQNELRKEKVKAGLKRANTIIEDQGLSEDPFLVLYTLADDADWFSEGIIGILAGKLAETYKVPTIVLTETEEPGILKGSGRSYGDVHLKHLLDHGSRYLMRFGGHPGAVGLTMRLDQVKKIRTCLIAQMKSVQSCQDKDTLYYDLEIKADQIPEAIEKLNLYAPFGAGNPSVTFMIKDFKLFPRYGKFCQYIGDGTTVKLFGKVCDAIGFHLADQYQQLSNPLALNLLLLGNLSTNVFMGQETPQVELIDFRKTEQKGKTNLAQKLSAKMKTF